tara:strand:+ start:337 stop:489 length:153 start_codon:yes stop_codon:yes gene_type:complete
MQTDSGDLETCPECSGTGQTERWQQSPTRAPLFTYCETCDGTGEILADPD